jgi:hypothetical protein
MMVSPFQLVLLVALVAIWVFPLWRILPRTGIHPAWSLVAIIWPFAIVLLWVIAYKKWPMDGYEADVFDD